MSGIVGLVNYEQVPIDQTLLLQMTSSLLFRGPDAQAVWSTETIGFGHSLLQTTDDTDEDKQPFTLEGQVWITADARIDGRAELIAKLNKCNRYVTSKTSDAALILHAYFAWHHDCLDYLIGDFAFAIWDGGKQLLFCACDQFGVVPFYYARVKQGLIFSNTLNCLRLHPEISDHLNDQAIADYLLFRQNQNATTTTFSDIQCLPASHKLIFQAGKIETVRYYTVPSDSVPLRLDKESCVEQFRYLFDQAVADRLRTPKIASYLSGGMDSTSVTATAHKMLRENKADFDLQAYTMTFEHRIPYHEITYATQVAQQLGIAHHQIAADSFTWDIDIDQQDFCPPEPSLIRASAFRFAALKGVANHGRVLLTGEGGDPLLPQAGGYWTNLIRAGCWQQLFKEGQHYYTVQSQLPIGLKSVLSTLKKKTVRQNIPALPSWLNQDLVKQQGLYERFLHHKQTFAQEGHDHQRGMLTDINWRRLFTWHDPGFSGFPVKVRHPFFDLRLLEFMLQLPIQVWTEQKFLLRMAMADQLPFDVLQRRKAFRSSHPFHVVMQHEGVPEWCKNLADLSILSHFVDVNKLKRMVLSPEAYLTQDYKLILRPLSLAYWLYKQEHTGVQPKVGVVRLNNIAYHK